MMDYLISPITDELARRVVGWRYDPPYDVYNLSAEDEKALMNPIYRYHQVQDSSGNLVGFCCYGEDACVPGGDYEVGEPSCLDVGVGLHPDLVGKGLGTEFVQAVLEHAAEIYRPENFRVTVAEFNQRSLKTFRRLGFKETNHFIRKPDGMPFIQLERSVHE